MSIRRGARRDLLHYADDATVRTDQLLTVALDREHERQSAAGITRYSSALAAALTELEDLAVLSVGGGSRLRRGTLRKKLLTARQDFWWYPFAGRREARRLDADVYHCTSPRGPLTRSRPPLVITIHDLASFRYPESLTRWTLFYERNFLPRVARAADRIIAPSADSASDIETILGVAPDKIRITPLGVDPIFFRSFRPASPFPFEYVLFVGTPQPRKNLERLMAAIELLYSRGSALRLVVVGSDGWAGVKLNTSRVHFAGRVNEEQLVTLYQHAACVALVSVHEGFGFPVLEAMAARTPVVASNVAALPEVSGGCAVLVDPLSVESIANGILEAIARRDDLVAAGRAHAARQTWTATADRTLAVYRELV